MSTSTTLIKLLGEKLLSAPTRLNPAYFSIMSTSTTLIKLLGEKLLSAPTRLNPAYVHMYVPH